MKQYFHQQYHNRFTMSLEVPDKSVLENLIQLGTKKEIWLETGIAYVHPKDTFYVKSIGREIADLHSEAIQYGLRHVKIDHDSLLLTLRSLTTLNQEIEIELRLLPKSTRAHFIHAELR